MKTGYTLCTDLGMDEGNRVVSLRARLLPDNPLYPEIILVLVNLPRYFSEEESGPLHELLDKFATDLAGAFGERTVVETH